MIEAEEWITHPSWFLIAGLSWPEDDAEAEVAEAAFAIAPDVTEAVLPADPDGEPVPLGRDFALMLDAGSRCAAAVGKRVLFVADITRWLDDIGLGWERIGVSFEIALNELRKQGIGVYLAISQRAHAVLCSPTRTLTLFHTSGRVTESGAEDRDLLRQNLEAVLNSGWPGYVVEVLANTPPAA